MGNVLSRKAAGDPTWKERHAKGVPVKLSSRQAIEWKKFSHLDDTVNVFHTWDYRTDELVVWIAEENDYPGSTATFCNFRYKPEWLARQSRKNCHGFASEHPKANCTAEL